MNRNRPRRVRCCLLAVVGVLGFGGLARSAQPEASSTDVAFQAAEAYVQQSDQYLHHSRLRRGMTGYGLSVFAGAEIERFDVEIVSIVHNFNIGQDVILARLSGQNLEHTHIIAGMSGSPVYIEDPEDGKVKLIGAVAYGWTLQTDPLCGIQPITHMLALPGVLSDLPPAEPDAQASQPVESEPAVSRTDPPVSHDSRTSTQASADSSDDSAPIEVFILPYGEYRLSGQSFQGVEELARRLGTNAQPGRQVRLILDTRASYQQVAVTTTQLGKMGYDRFDISRQAVESIETPEPDEQALAIAAATITPAEPEPVSAADLPLPSLQNNRLELQLRSGGTYCLGGVDLSDEASLQAMLERLNRRDAHVALVAPKGLGLSPVVQTLKLLRSLGYEDVEILTEQFESGPSQPTSAPVAGPPVTRQSVEQFWAEIFDRSRTEFTRPARNGDAAARAAGLTPLPIPMCMGGATPDLLTKLTPQLSPLGLLPVQGGSAGGVDEELSDELAAIELAPGSSVSIPLVRGDADWSAIGTVTDVRDETILAFGHGMFSEGLVHLPMATGYVHAVVSSLTTSFKLGSVVRPVGTLSADHAVGIAGQLGPVADMIPVQVTVTDTQAGITREFSYELIDDWFYTSYLGPALIAASAESLSSPPQYHHVRHEVEIDFGPFGVFHTAGISNGISTYNAMYDAQRALVAMLENPFAKVARPNGIRVAITILPGDISAEVLEFRLPGQTYQPGQTVMGTALLERFRQERVTIPVSITLPRNLPDGEYQLTLGDSSVAVRMLERDQPQVFQPRTPTQIVTALNRLLQPENDHLYLYLSLPDTGLAIDQTPLPNLPASKAMVLSQADLPDVRPIRRSLQVDIPTDYVVQGQQSVTITVQRQDNQLRLHAE